MDQDFNLWQQLVLGATKPFRMGSNILGQYYGSALTGKDMTQQSNQGKFLQWLSSALTPEEQTQIEEKPYLNALKSSAGMASTLMPFAKIGSIGKVGSNLANPTLSKFAQLLTRGGLEGGVGGFGYSREGRELQDTLIGAGLGAGGEVLGGLISDPTFRRGMGQEFKNMDNGGPGRYRAMLDMGGDQNITGSLNVAKSRPGQGSSIEQIRGSSKPEELILYHQSQSEKPLKSFIQKGEKGYGKASYSQGGFGVYFSPDKDLVSSKYGGGGGQLIKARVKLESPLDLGEFDSMYYDGTMANSTDIAVDNFKRQITGQELLPEPDILLTNITSKARKWLIDNGYDSVVGQRGKMWSAPEYVVLDPNKIKILEQTGPKPPLIYSDDEKISRSLDNDLLDEMKKTNRRWGLNR